MIAFVLSSSRQPRGSSRRHLLVLLVVALTMVWPALPAQAGPPPGRAQYTIEAAIDFAARTVVARERVRFVNRTGGVLPDLVFTITPAHFGGFTIEGAAVGGKAAAAKLDGVMLTVALPETLPPNGAVDVDLAFRLTVPRQGGRYGVSEGVMALGNWFPILSVYRAGRLADPDLPIGWDRHRYVDAGDAFFTETADYDVRIETDPALTLAHTGDLVKRDGGIWQIRAEDVRDFAMALSNQWQARSQQIGDVAVTTFVLPGHQAMGDLYLRAGGEMLAWMAEYVGPYPHRSLHLAEIGAGSTGTSVGQEYPGLIFISSGPTSLGGGIDSYLAYLVIHEVAHQWFYALIGNDQIYEPWLDEALVTWASMHFYRHRYPSGYPAVWQSRVLGRLGNVRGRIGGMSINTSIYDYGDENLYFTVVYRQGAVFLEDAYQKVGEATMRRVLQRFYQAYRGRIATSSGFLDLLQSETAVNLSPLIAEYFSYLRYQRGEPLRFSLTVPETADGELPLGVRSEGELAKVQVFVDDVPAWTGVPGPTVAVPVGAFEAGEHLLTVVATDAGGRRADRVAVFRRTGALTAMSTPAETPTATATAAATPTETPTATAEPTETATPVAEATCCEAPPAPEETPDAGDVEPPEARRAPPEPDPRTVAVAGALGGAAALGLALMMLRSLMR